VDSLFAACTGDKAGRALVRERERRSRNDSLTPTLLEPTTDESVIEIHRCRIQPGPEAARNGTVRGEATWRLLRQRSDGNPNAEGGRRVRGNAVVSRSRRTDRCDRTPSGACPVRQGRENYRRSGGTQSLAGGSRQSPD